MLRVLISAKTKKIHRNTLYGVILGILIPFAGYADCDKPVTALRAGESAPCDGFLFTRAKEGDVRFAKEQADLKFKELDLAISQLTKTNQEVENFKKALDLETEKTEAWQEVAERYSAKYEKAEAGQMTHDILIFSAGIAFTVVVGGTLVWIFARAGASTAAAGGAL